MPDAPSPITQLALRSHSLWMAMVLWTVPSIVLADDWHEVALYRCDHAQDAVQIEFLGAWNEDGVALVGATPGLQSLTRVVGRRDKPPGEDHHWETYRACNLSKGIVELQTIADYVVTVERLNRECGAWSNYRIVVTFNGQRMHEIVPDEWCKAGTR